MNFVKPQISKQQQVSIQFSTFYGPVIKDLWGREAAVNPVQHVTVNTYLISFQFLSNSPFQ